MTTRITPNLFLSNTSSSSKTDDVPTTTIFFISGNPGLISYYHDFLSLVSEKLASEDEGSSGFRIYGANLGGFYVGDRKEEDKNKKKGNDDPSTLIPGHLYSLEEQIDFVEKKLHALMRDSASSEPEPMNPRRATRSATAITQKADKQKVILIGHSVGAYIAMEILRRHREEEKMGDGEVLEEEEGSFDIIGAVLLFPTVIDIAKSAAGKRLTWLLYFIPQLALVASLVVKVLTFIFPDWALRFLVRLVMGNPPSSAVESTLSFLKSERGVRQALHMAADEMRTITSDKWSDDIWGTSRAGKPPSRLVFYFGRNDHWVAERTRDEIIESRGSKDGPTMIVCEDSIPHAFCIRHSPVMARKVARFIKDIMLE